MHSAAHREDAAPPASNATPNVAPPRRPTSDRSLERARAILRANGPRLRARRPWIYWTDLLGTAALGWSSLLVACTQPGPLAVLALAVAVLAFHRGVSFLHELSHVRYAVPGWDFAWNVLVGIPLLLPSFVYSRVHVDHHARQIFGTPRDPEYTRIRGSGPLRPLLMVLGSTCSPLVLALRWLVVAPLSLLHPSWRGFVIERLSSLTGKLDYARPRPRGTAVVRWSLLEAAASVWAWGLVLCLAGGLLPAQVALCAVALAVSVSVLHALRSFGTHRFSASGEVLPFEAQFLDSVNFTGHPVLTELWAPAGLRYHALHHLAPDLPYHALGEAHRLLVAELPDDDLYHHATVSRVSELVRAVAHAVSDRGSPAAEAVQLKTA